MRRVLAGALALLLVAACGPATVSGTGLAGAGMPAAGGSAEAQATARLASIRSGVGLGRLRFSPSLGAAAEVHARDMVTAGFRGHRGSDGSSFRTRAERAGNDCALAENIAFGADVDGAFDWWLSSPPHRAAMLRPDLSTFGIAEVERTWVLVLGRC